MTFLNIFILMSNCFADDISLFSIVHDVDTSPVTPNNDLVEIQEWAYNREMYFNPDRNKQAQ